MPKRTRWPADRLAQAAFLAGRGWPAGRIAAHVEIKSNSFSVLQQLRAIGFDPGEESEDLALIAVPSRTAVALAPHAKKRRVAPDELATRLLDLLAADPVLLDNVLDDDEIVMKQATAFREALVDLAQEAAG